MQPLVSRILTILAILASAPATRGEDLDVPSEKIEGGAPADMMKRYLMRQSEQAIQRWKADYEKRKTPAEIAAYQQRAREDCLKAIGGLPERTPLEPQVVGTISRPGYHVEKIIFQSQPKHYVTALLFLPDAQRFPPPYPGVLVPCGHYLSAKAHSEYQSMGALLALNGMAALVFDPVDQGERGQYMGKDGWPTLWGVEGHCVAGVGCILLGQNLARFEIWDGMRAIDYLQSRPEVDPQRIGCTGNSGGGTQTSFLMALDDRIRAAAPSCYLMGMSRMLATIGCADSEQHFFGQMVFGVDHADLITMRAPSPVLVLAATQDFFDIGGTWDTFRYAKRLYTRLGFAERVDILENDAVHNYNNLQREGAARWMSRWLLGKDQPITEPPIALLTEKECQCTADGKVMSFPGARSVYDLNEDCENEWAKRRASSWVAGDRVALLEQVRRLAGIRKLSELPEPKVEVLGTVARTGYQIEKLLIKPEEGISLPGLLFLPEKPKPDRVVLYLHDKGKAADAAPGGPIEQRVQAGDVVLAVDLRGTGQTQQALGDHYCPEWKDAYNAYVLGRSYVGMRAEDVLVCTRYAAQRAAGGPPTVHLVAIGNVGIAALHAAALEPNLFAKVELSRTLISWATIIHDRLNRNQVANVVHDALEYYDLPNLAATLGDKLTVAEPVNAVGAVVAGKQVSVRIADAADVRIAWAKARLEESLKKAGYELIPDGKPVVDISVDASRQGDKAGTPESYRLVAAQDRVSVMGCDSAGAMYGCLELAEHVRRAGRLPEQLDLRDGPKMSLRGTSVLLMKLGTYDYPVTPKEFPFFYDRSLWKEYLDFLAENRFNYIAFWNGHPFDYFVKLDKYPEAQDGMAPGLLERNHDMLLWLAKEAEKRNIWLMFEFYNIHTSVYFQKAHGLPALNHQPTPLLADYTGYCIERFVNEFPSVGLYICPGEALQLEYTDAWIKDVILAAVERTGKTPPVMVRAWGIDLPHMKKLAGSYPRLYTERKYNVEMIAGTDVDPENREWSKMTGNHVVNIHCMGNLEPFRWSPPSYVQRCLQSAVRDGGGTGLQVYPRKAWRWPYGCDRIDRPELQWDRDWMWFQVWARYAWNPDRDPAAEREYWMGQLAERYGPQAAPHLLKALEDSADVLPSLQRLIWLGNDNHTIVPAGIMLDQLQKVEGVPFLPLPDMVRIPQFLDAVKTGKMPPGQTPVELLSENVEQAEKAWHEAELGARAAIRSQADAGRIATDLQAVSCVARYYRDKFAALVAKTRFDAGIDKAENRKACLRELQASVDEFRQLTELTKRTYDSISDVPAWNPTRALPCPYHWSDVLPLYERELEEYRKSESLRVPNIGQTPVPFP